MAVVKVTKQDLAMNTIPPVQWASARIIQVEGPLRAASGKSSNYFVTTILDDSCLDAPGKKHRTCVNDTNGLGNFYPIFAAVRDVPVSTFSPGDELDTDELIDADVDVKVSISEGQNGQPISIITDWLPLGKGTVKSGF